MIRSILAREDSVYKAFPDIAITSDGTLICTYRESLCHGPSPFSRVVVQLSQDGGLNWGKKQTVHVCEDSERDGCLNNPRLLSLKDNRLLLICDWTPPKETQTSLKSEIFLWRSNDSGQSWSEVKKTGIRGSICPCFSITKSNKIILGGDKFDDSSKVWTHQAYISSDWGSSWDGPIEVASSPKLSLNEGTYVELDNGLIVCYIREDKERICAYKAISKDEGKTWEGPYPTSLLSCRGRPKAGLLRTGEVAITYGFDIAPRQLTLHIETQSTAADPNYVKNYVKKEESYATPIYLGLSTIASAPTPTIRRFFIDYDRSIHPDAAYSGWVQLPSGDIYVVQYITDDAPMAHIRSYQISRSDWILGPEGNLICIRPSIQCHEIALEASADQYRKVHDRGA